jgi:hypothetical protein
VTALAHPGAAGISDGATSARFLPHRSQLAFGVWRCADRGGLALTSTPTLQCPVRVEFLVAAGLLAVLAVAVLVVDLRGRRRDRAG